MSTHRAQPGTHLDGPLASRQDAWRVCQSHAARLVAYGLTPTWGVEVYRYMNGWGVRIVSNPPGQDPAAVVPTLDRGPSPVHLFATG